MSTIKGVPDSITDPLWEAVAELYGGTAHPSPESFGDYATGFWHGVRFASEYPKLVKQVSRILWTPARYDLDHEESGHVHPPEHLDVLAGRWAEVVYVQPDDDAHLDLVKQMRAEYEHPPAKSDPEWDLRDLVWEVDAMRGDDS